MKTMNIKRYSNRKLYLVGDKENEIPSKYVTIKDLAQEVKSGTIVNVFDYKTGENITNSVLKSMVGTLDLENDVLISVITNN